MDSRDSLEPGHGVEGCIINPGVVTRKHCESKERKIFHAVLCQIQRCGRVCQEESLAGTYEMCSFHALQTGSYLRANSLLVCEIGNIAARDKALYFFEYHVNCHGMRINSLTCYVRLLWP